MSGAPPSSERYCLGCKAKKRFIYDRHTFHSHCETCYSTVATKKQPRNKEYEAKTIQRFINGTKRIKPQKK